MKKISDYKKQFSVTPETTLKDLKSTYRNLMKEWHPDKFANDEVQLAEAEAQSKNIIAAYHFLVSIAPETISSQLEEYTETITNSGIEDFSFKKQVLEVKFTDGSVYEYLGVQEKIYVKLCQSATQYRFGKRHIFNSFLYRQIKKKEEVEVEA